MNELTDTRLESLPWNEDLRLGLGFEHVVDNLWVGFSESNTEIRVRLSNTSGLVNPAQNIRCTLMGRGFSSNASLLKTDLDFGGASYHGGKIGVFPFPLFFLGKAQKSMRTLHGRLPTSSPENIPTTTLGEKKRSKVVKLNRNTRSSNTTFSQNYGELT